MKSLFLKLAMVTITVGIVYWIGWPLSGPHRVSQSPTLPQGVTQTVSKQRDHVRQPSVQLASQDQSATFATTEQLGLVRASGDRLLDLNRANAADLEALPGIGAVLAQRVIAFRQSAGGFRSIEDLRRVKGIGAKKFVRLKPLVTVLAVDQKDVTEMTEWRIA